MGSEYARQREHMERSVASLRKKLAKDTEIHRKDNIRVMQVKSHRALSLELEYQTGDYCLLYHNHHTNSFFLSLSLSLLLSHSHTQENVSLLKEINDLRTELKKSRTTAHDLEAILKIARKQGFDETAALASTAPQLAPTGLVKSEPADSQRVIGIQRAEISRLRGLLREREGGVGRPPSGARLPPVQHSTPLPVV